MDPYSLIARIRARGLTQSSIALELAVSPAAVHRVIFSKGKSLRIAACIAAKIEESIESLWPGRYSMGNDDDLAALSHPDSVPDYRRSRTTDVTRSRSERKAA